MNTRAFGRVAITVLAVLIVTALVLPSVAEAQGRVHVVQRGETLSGIAWRYGTSVNAIMRANGLTNRNFIWVGQRLTIPGSGGGGSSGGGGGSGGGVHVVRPGENLTQIARRYGTTVSAIANANGIRNTSFIWVGQRLVIPGGGSSGGGGSRGAEAHP